MLAYLNGELSGEEHAAFESHLAACPSCRAFLRNYEQTIRLGHDAFREEPPVPTELVDAILSATRGLGLHEATPPTADSNRPI